MIVVMTIMIRSVVPNANKDIGIKTSIIVTYTAEII